MTSGADGACASHAQYGKFLGELADNHAKLAENYGKLAENYGKLADNYALTLLALLSSSRSSSSRCRQLWHSDTTEDALKSICRKFTRQDKAFTCKAV